MRGIAGWKRNYGRSYTVVYIFKALGNPVRWSIEDCVGYVLTEMGVVIYGGICIYSELPCEQAQGRA